MSALFGLSAFLGFCFVMGAGVAGMSGAPGNVFGACILAAAICGGIAAFFSAFI
jgi:hypothetical protein